MSRIIELLIPALVLLTPSAYGKLFQQDLAVLVLLHIPLNLHTAPPKKADLFCWKIKYHNAQNVQQYFEHKPI